MIPPDQPDPSSGAPQRPTPDETPSINTSWNDIRQPAPVVGCNDPHRQGPPQNNPSSDSNNDASCSNAASGGTGTSDGAGQLRRYRLQQSILSAHRFSLKQALAAFFPDNELIMNLYNNQIVGKLHKAPWAEIGPLFLKLAQTELPMKGGTIALGGWKHRAPTGFEDDLVEVPNKILDPLIRLRGFKSVKKAIDNLVSTHKPLQSEPKLLSLVQKNDFLLQNVVDPFNIKPMDYSKLRIDDLGKTVEREISINISSLESEFAYLDHKGFVFLPGEESPLRGWQDFIHFCTCYNCLPISRQKQMGPYYFYIEPPCA